MRKRGLKKVMLNKQSRPDVRPPSRFAHRRGESLSAPVRRRPGLGSVVWTALLLLACLVAPVAGARPAGASTPFDAGRFSNILQSALQGRSVGYEFTVGQGHQAVDLRAGGIARADIDQPAETMSPFVQFSIASMSKDVTAVAALQLLDRLHLPLDTSIQPYLPAEWRPAAGFGRITFRQLLTHTSGIQSTSAQPLLLDYWNLKSFAENAPACNPTSQSYPCLGPAGVGRYENANFAYFRFLIPVLAGNPGSFWGTGWGAAYVSDVQQGVFTQLNMPGMTCATGSWTGLDYHYEPNGPTQPGWNLGDLTDLCGSQGWVMSTIEYNHFFREVQASDSGIPYTRWLGGNGSPGTGPTLGDLMKQTCIGYAQQPCGASAGLNGGTYWAHGGYYPDNRNPGEFNGATVTFDNGVSVTVFVNSPLGYDNDSPLQAMLDAYTSTIAGPTTASLSYNNWAPDWTVQGLSFPSHAAVSVTIVDQTTQTTADSAAGTTTSTYCSRRYCVLGGNFTISSPTYVFQTRTGEYRFDYNPLPCGHTFVAWVQVQGVAGLFWTNSVSSGSC